MSLSAADAKPDRRRQARAADTHARASLGGGDRPGTRRAARSVAWQRPFAWGVDPVRATKERGICVVGLERCPLEIRNPRGYSGGTDFLGEDAGLSFSVSGSALCADSLYPGASGRRL